MSVEELYHFLFETIPGIGILVGAGLVISIICCFIFEVRTRKRFRNHEAAEVDEWSILDDDEDEEEERESDEKESAR